MEFLIKYRKPLACLALALALFVTGWLCGADYVQAKWDKQKKDDALAAAQQGQQQAVATVVEVIKYVDRVRLVQGKTQTIIKEVPKYVTIRADADCVINNGFVRLHCFAATDTVPDAPRDSDAAPSGVELSTVASTVAGNYGLCAENAAQLDALQSWVRAMVATYAR